jgi:hypothetical protein
VLVNGRPVLLDAGGHFFADHVELAPGDNGVTVSLVTPGYDPIVRTLRVTSAGVKPFAMSMDANEGLAPLTVNVTISNRGNVPFTRVDITGRTDLAPQVTWTSMPDNERTATFIFDMPGVYAMRARVFDADERVIYDGTRYVVVRDPLDLASRAVLVFDAMRDSLRRGDVATALANVTDGMQGKYAAVFSALRPQLPTIADQLGTVQEVTVTDNVAEIALLRTAASGDSVFHVYVIRSEDGLWRIDGM